MTRHFLTKTLVILMVASSALHHQGFSDDDITETIRIATSDSNPVAELRLNFITGALLTGNKRRLEEFLAHWINLMKIPGVDSEQPYHVEISANPFPNAYMRGRTIVINLGLIAFVNNLTELLSVVAHEMTHGNREHMRLLEQNRGLDSTIEAGLVAAGVNEEDHGLMREELRADIGALDRIIRAGLNPNTVVQLEARFGALIYPRGLDRLLNAPLRSIFRDEFAFQHSHPHPMIRAQAARAYILYRLQNDLDITTLSSPDFPGWLRGVKRVVELYANVVTGIWIKRVLGLGVVSGAAVLTKDLAIAAVAALGLDGASAEATLMVTDAIANSGQSVLDLIFGNLHIFMGGVAALATSSFVWMLNESARGSRGGTILERITLARLREVLNRVGAIGRMTRSNSALEPLEALETWTYWLEGLGHAIDRSSIALDNMDQLGISSALSIATRELSLAIRESPANPEPPRLHQLFGRILSLSFCYTDLGVVEAILEKLSEFPEDAPDAHRLAVIKSKASRFRLILTGEIKFASIEDQLYHFRELASQQEWSLLTLMAPQFVPAALEYLASSPSSRQLTFQREIFHLTLLQIQNRSNGKLGESQRILAWQTVGSAMATFLSQTTAVGSKVWFEQANLRIYTGADRATNMQARQDFERFLTQNVRSFEQLVAFLDQVGSARIGFMMSSVISYVRSNPHLIGNTTQLQSLLSDGNFWPLPEKQLDSIQTDFDRFLIQHFSELSTGVLVSRFSRLPRQTEATHQWAIQRRAELYGDRRTTASEDLAFWRALTENGVSVTSDLFFIALMARLERELSPELWSDTLVELAQLANNERRVLDSTIRGMVFRRVFFDSTTSRGFQARFAAATSRYSFIGDVQDELFAALSDSPIARTEFLEELATRINATYTESEVIHAAKTRALERSTLKEDLATRALSSIVEAIGSWPNRDRWQLVYFLRGDGDPPASFERWSKHLPPEYLKLFFDNLPLSARIVTINGILVGTGAPIDPTQVTPALAGEVVRRILAGKPESEVDIAVRLVEALMAGMRHAGIESLQVELLGFILANYGDGSEGSTGQVVKNVLEYFGSLGIKVGQFLAATNLLGAHTSALSQLEDSAQRPTHHEVWTELIEAVPNFHNRYEVVRLLGSASIKFAVLVRRKSDGELKVLKVTRARTRVTSANYFKIIEGALDYLSRVDSRNFGVFESVLTGGRLAFGRELNPTQEVANSDALRPYYESLSTPEIEFRVPHERVIADRVIEADFAEGTSIRRLAPADQRLASNAMVAAESRDWGSPGLTNRLLEPDRHPGNWLIHREGNKLIINIIDTGQAINLPLEEYRQIVSLMAAAQIFAHSGASAGVIDMLASLLGLNSSEKRRLTLELGRMFPQMGLQPMARYFGVLTALARSRGNVPDSFYAYPVSLAHVDSLYRIPRSGAEVGEGSLQAQRFARSVGLEVERLARGLGLIDYGRTGLEILWNRGISGLVEAMGNPESLFEQGSDAAPAPAPPDDPDANLTTPSVPDCERTGFTRAS